MSVLHGKMHGALSCEIVRSRFLDSEKAAGRILVDFYSSSGYKVLRAGGREHPGIFTIHRCGDADISPAAGNALLERKKARPP
jgi:hypothetical protein